MKVEDLQFNKEDHQYEVKIEGQPLFRCPNLQKARAIHELAEKLFCPIIVSLEADENLDISDVEHFLIKLSWFVRRWLEVDDGIVRYRGRIK